MKRSLILIRHGQSEWNLKNLFTGWKNPDLTPKGIEEAIRAGELLHERNIRFDSAYTSELKRAKRTCQIILEGMRQSSLKAIRTQSLNERDYGDLAGLNKDDARKKWGAEQVHKWRRSYDTAPPGGESLKDTGARVWPYYLTHILPAVLRGECVLVAAHGNSLRALVMILDRLTGKQVAELNLETGAPIIYRLNADSTVMSREAVE